MDLIEQILKEAEEELLFDKEANDQNGSPDTPAKQNGGGDILSTAQELLQQIEQFKAALGEGVAAQANVDPNIVQDPNAQAIDPATGQPVAVDPNTAAQQSGDSSVVIVRPDGTQIKVASLMKIAALRGKKIFEEVK